MKNFLIITALAVLLLTKAATVAQALTRPSFPACEAPAGTVIASYDSGVHGIVGDSKTYVGSDVVFQIDADRVLQCYCEAGTTKGIETLWWKAGSLNQDEISILQKEGWIWVPTGSVWGLADSAYMAKNRTYSCGGVGGTVESASATNSNSSSSSSSNGVGGGSMYYAPTGFPMVLPVAAGVTLLAAYALFRMLSA